MTTPVLLLTGPPGSGKTTVLQEVSGVLASLEAAHAAIDLDQLARMWPRPPDDLFNTAVMFDNLCAVWATYRHYGARALLLARVIESRAELASYHAAISNAAITVCRLVAPPAVCHTRLAAQEAGASLEWHSARSSELASSMGQARVEDFTVSNDMTVTPHDCALEVVDLWLHSLSVM